MARLSPTFSVGWKKNERSAGAGGACAECLRPFLNMHGIYKTEFFNIRGKPLKNLKCFMHDTSKKLVAYRYNLMYKITKDGSYLLLNGSNYLHKIFCKGTLLQTLENSRRASVTPSPSPSRWWKSGGRHPPPQIAGKARLMG